MGFDLNQAVAILPAWGLRPYRSSTGPWRPTSFDLDQILAAQALIPINGVTNMPYSASTRARIDELVAHLNGLRDQQLDFPAIWRNYMRGHPLIMGIPIQVHLGSKPELEVELINGGRLQFRDGRFRLR